ncbi:unnamed protein product [Closterium sp. NIES-54]
MFTRRPGSSLYTLATNPPQVAASAQVSASGPVAPPCSCRLLSHQTLLWHHRLGHPSLPRLRGMHSCLLPASVDRVASANFCWLLMTTRVTERREPESRRPLLSRSVLSSLLSRPVPSTLLSRRVAPLLSRRVAPFVPYRPVRVALPVPSRRTRPVRPARRSRPVRPARPLRPVRLARPSRPHCALPVRRAPCALPVRACRACPCRSRPFRRVALCVTPFTGPLGVYGFGSNSIHLYASVMATPRVLHFDAEGRLLEFSVWLMRAHRLLESQVQAHETLWAHASGDLPEPDDPAPLAADPTPADNDCYACERADVTAWKSRDAAACIALSSLLPEFEETHFTQVRTASEFLTAIKARYATPTTVSLGRMFLPFLFPDLASFERTADLITHLRSLDSSYRAASTDAQLALLPPPMAITIYFIATSLPGRLASVRDALLLKHPSELTIEVLESALKDVESNLRSVASASGVVPPPLFHGCTVPQLPTFTASLATAATDVTAGAVTTSSRSWGRSGKRGGQVAGGGGGGGGGDLASGGGGSAGTGGAPHATAGDSPAAAGGGDAQTYGPALWGMSASHLVDLLGTPHAMYAVVDSSASDFVYSSVVSLGASLAEVPIASVGTCVDTSPGASPEDASLSFTLDSGAWHSFFRDRTTLTPLPTPVSVALADPTSRPVIARYTTTLPCPAVPSGSLTGFHVPSFLRKLVGVRPLVSQHVGVWIEPSGETTICVDGDTYMPLATFTPEPGSSLYTLHTGPRGQQQRQQQLLPPTPVIVPRQVPASHQVVASPKVAVSGQVPVYGLVAASCSCRSLAHPTILWHHRMRHPSISRLRAMSSQRLVLGLPRVLPSLPPSLAPPCSPCVEGQLRATPHSSSLRPATEPFETLHLDVWGLASRPGPERESFFLVVVDDYSHYTTVFPLAKKSDLNSTLIRWLLTTADTRGRRVSCLHSDRGGEFCSGVLAGFCREQGIRQSWMLPESPQQNGVAERRICLVMEIAHTSMTHARAPHFLWPYTIRYAAHQLNLWPRVSWPEVSPTSLWTGSPGAASRFRVWGCLALVRDTSADKISPLAVLCVFLGFPEDSSDYTFYHPLLHRFFDSRDVRFDESVPYYVRYPCRGLPVPPAPLFLTSAPPPAPPVQPPPPGPAPSGVSHATPPPSVAPQVQPPSPQSSSQPTADPAGAGFCGEDPGGASSVRIWFGGGGCAASPAPPPPPSPTAAAAAEGGGCVGANGVVLGGGVLKGGSRRVASSASSPEATISGSPASLLRQTPVGPLLLPLKVSRGASYSSSPEATISVQPNLGFAICTQLLASETSLLCFIHFAHILTSSRGARVGAESVAVRGPGSGGAGVGAEPVTAGDSSLRGAGVSGAGVSGAVPGSAPFAGPGEPGTDPVTSGGAGSGGGATGSLESDPGATTAPDTTPPPHPYPTRHQARVHRASAGAIAAGAATAAAAAVAAGAGAAPAAAATAAAATSSSCLWSSDPRSPLSFSSLPPLSSYLWVKRPPGSPPVFKARYVARDFSQREGVDFFLTFAPTSKMTTLWVLLHVAAQRDYELHSLDFSTAFLQGSLHEEVWLRRPSAFTGTFPLGTQWRRRRPVYGLRQAPREWQETLCSTLSDLGFQPSSADPSLFVRRGSTPFFVLVYVDDLVFAIADKVALADVKLELQKRHTCTDLGELRHYLGLQITRDRAARTITLSQSHMMEQILQRFELQHSTVQCIPLAVDLRLIRPFPDEPFEPSGPYAELVGCLMYLMTCTRPDLAFPLSILARFVASGRHRCKPLYEAMGACCPCKNSRITQPYTLQSLNLGPNPQLKKSPSELVLKWIDESWADVPEEMVRKAFLTCGISNAEDGSQNHLILVHMRDSGEVEVQEDVMEEEQDELIPNPFYPAHVVTPPNVTVEMEEEAVLAAEAEEANEEAVPAKSDSSESDDGNTNKADESSNKGDEWWAPGRYEGAEVEEWVAGDKDE